MHLPVNLDRSSAPAFFVLSRLRTAGQGCFLATELVTHMLFVSECYVCTCCVKNSPQRLSDILAHVQNIVKLSHKLEDVLQ